MIGGDLLATGSSSCIFRPNIPCKGLKGNVSNKKISKIVYGEKALRYYDKEQKITKILKSIKGYNKWSIVYEKFCDPPTYENIFKYDKNILDCKDKDYEKIFDESSKMMVSRFGGDTLEDYFIDRVIKDRSFKKVESSMYTLLQKMKQLFIGLNKISQKQLVHLDIKYNNLVLDGEYFKYIDFGLSGELRDTEHFKNRSLSEFSTKRVYLWYPFEYLYAVIDGYSKEIEIDYFSKRKHFKTGADIHKLFDVQLSSHVKGLLYSNKSYTPKEYQKLVSMIDIYSLGILIPFLFVEYDLVEYVEQSAFLKDLFKLCRDMCKLDYKERITSGECLKRYTQLMINYSGLSKGKKTKRKNKL
jgi:serine/threonine protein kinase